MAEKYIHFIANYDDWVAIRKLKIDEKTDAFTIMEFLAGLCISVDNKIEQNLGKIVNIEKVKRSLEELEYGKSEQEIAKILREVNSGRVNKVIKEVIKEISEKYQKNELKEIESFCKIYAFRCALKKCNLAIDYSFAESPTLKRLLKKGKKQTK